MPLNNNFQHQVYTSDPPAAVYELLAPPYPAQAETESYQQQMARIHVALTNQVDAIYLVHGTFVGNDALGWTAQIEKFWPQAASHLRTLGKRLVDLLADDTGNYTQHYVQQLAAIGPRSADTETANQEQHWPIRLFQWSGENNHIARCRAAITLLDDLFRRLESEQRVLLLCHSHAGNVLALVSNLLGGDDPSRQSFLALLLSVYRDVNEQAQFQRVSEQLSDPQLRKILLLDIVNLGTPIRYGWDSGGYRNLMHFVHHVPRPGDPEYLSPLPQLNSTDMLNLEGDFVQQFGIAGTNIMPYVIDLPLVVAEYRIGKMLQPLGRRRMWEHLKIGMRVAHEGTTLLVRYENIGGLARRAAGHGIYTRHEWMLFHFQQIARHFYGLS